MSPEVPRAQRLDTLLRTIDLAHLDSSIRHAGLAESSRMGVQMLGAPRDLVLTMNPADATSPEPPLETAELLHDAEPDQYLPSLLLRDVENGLLVSENASGNLPATDAYAVVLSRPPTGEVDFRASVGDGRTAAAR